VPAAAGFGAAAAAFSFAAAGFDPAAMNSAMAASMASSTSPSDEDSPLGGGALRVLGRVLRFGIWIFAPQNGQIPFLPA